MNKINYNDYNVFLIENDISLSESIKAILSYTGYNTLNFLSFKYVIKYLDYENAFTPDIIIISYNIIKQAGMEQLKKIKMKYSAICLIMMPDYRLNSIMFESLLDIADDLIYSSYNYDFLIKIMKKNIIKYKPVLKKRVINTNPIVDNQNYTERDLKNIKQSLKSHSVEIEKYVRSLTHSNNNYPRQNLIAIGSSAGGTEALQNILCHFPASTPPVIISQHLPAEFIPLFAVRLNDICYKNIVKVAENNEMLKSGYIYIAPGNYHLLITHNSEKYYIKLMQGPKVSGHCPSVDVMFTSVSENAGDNAVGVILTGMGHDGSEGMYKMFKSGASTIAQSEKTCQVFGMPRQAIAKGGVKYIIDLEDIPGKIFDIINPYISQI